MALVVYDRVQETTTTTGTGTITLAGAVAGFQSFAVVGNGNTTYYTITSGTAWEVGIGTYTSSGTTLARTTILSNSNGNTSPITLSGTSNVFVTYPSEVSVTQGSALGTPASGTLTNCTGYTTSNLSGNISLTSQVTGTLPVANGGTGVTASSGASSVVLRDANSNVTANNFLAGYNVITAAAGTTVLTASSAYYQRISGSTTQTIQLPIATTLVQGQGFTFDNDSSGAVSIVDSASGAIDTVPSGGYSYIFAEDVTTSAGSWGKYALLPASYDFSTTSANFGSAVISNTTYQGTAVAPGYGGTGLTTFSAANNAIYSTSASALAAGTLPVAAGGTGLATTPANGALDIGNGTGFTRTTLTAGTGISVTNASGGITITNTSPSSGGTVTSVTGTAPVVSSGGNTPAISMAAATTSVSGYLTSTDWNTFNGKVSTAVTSAVAGTGISVSASTGAVTFTNSGVTSAVAGTGITVSGATGAVTVSIGQAVATSSNVQFNSLGVGTAGSTTAGEIRATNNITAYYSSDAKFKENIRPIENALDKIKVIGGKEFDWTDEYIDAHGGEDGYFIAKEDFGLIAQDVQKVFPKAVKTRPDGSLAVDYTKLGVLAFQGIVELLKRIEALEAK